MTFEDLYIDDFMNSYEVHIDPDNTMGDVILNHLFSKPGFIGHSRSKNKTIETDLYSESIHKSVSKGSPIDVFINAFSPKVTNPEITNQYRYPDMSDFLAIIHLQLIAKHIRTLYDYGFRFIIGFNGKIYQPVMGWTDEEVQKTFNLLNGMIKKAEYITNARNSVLLYDMNQLMNDLGKPFDDELMAKYTSLKQEYVHNDSLQSSIDKWTKDMKKFSNPEFLNQVTDQHLIDTGLFIRSVRSLQYIGGRDQKGVLSHFPNAILGNVRGNKDKISFQLNPFFHFHPHQRLILLNNQKQWETFKWTEKKVSPVYVPDYPHPFYFEDK